MLRSCIVHNMMVLRSGPCGSRLWSACGAAGCGLKTESSYVVIHDDLARSGEESPAQAVRQPAAQHNIALAAVPGRTCRAVARLRTPQCTPVARRVWSSDIIVSGTVLTERDAPALPRDTPLYQRKQPQLDPRVVPGELYGCVSCSQGRRCHWMCRSSPVFASNRRRIVRGALR